MTKKNKDKKLRIMINTNAVWSHSGYAQQARQFVPKMAEEGYPTAIINFYGQEGGIFELDGVTQYPRIASTWGDDAMVNHGKHFNSDVIFTLQDIWTLQDGTFAELARQKRRWIPIVPIDHEPVVPAIHKKLKAAYRIVTYSPFGQRELKRVGLHSTYIPHTVETDKFKKYDKKEIRKQAQIPEDIFLFGMVAANKDNPPRKGFQHVLDAFKVFHDKYPKSGIYFHTLPRHQNGFPILDYAQMLGVKDALYFVDEYEHMYAIPPERMGQIYSTLDCYLMPSQNEGFGVPAIEAQSCEVPVIATNFTALRDLVKDGETGFHLNVERKTWSPLQSYVAVPSTQHLLELMEKVYKMSQDERNAMGKAGREFVKNNFDIDLVWKKHWVPFLETLEDEIYNEKTIEEVMVENKKSVDTD